MEDNNLIEDAKIEGLEELVSSRDSFIRSLMETATYLVLTGLSSIFGIGVLSNLLGEPQRILVWALLVVSPLATGGALVWLTRRFIAVQTCLRYYEARIAAKEENHLLLERIAALKVTETPGS